MVSTTPGVPSSDVSTCRGGGPSSEISTGVAVPSSEINTSGEFLLMRLVLLEFFLLWVVLLEYGFLPLKLVLLE